MKKLLMLLCFMIFALKSGLSAETSLEPFTYSENFEERELNGWFSYPIYEDSAYDSGFRVNEFVHGDPNISIEQIVTPHFNVDTYCGAQKLLDMYLTPGSSIKLRYYLKTHLAPEYFQLRLAAGKNGSIDYTIQNPATNKWAELSVDFDSIAAQNPSINGKSAVKVNGIAVLGKIPDADTKMNIVLGLDDVVFKGARMTEFRFSEPEVKELSEWKQRIAKKPYIKGDFLNLKGAWAVDSDKVILDISKFEKPSEIIWSAKLTGKNGEWSLKPLKLDFDENLYLGILRAYKKNELTAQSEFTFHVAPDLGNTHPRLWFTNETKQTFLDRLNTDRFKPLRERIANQAKNARDKVAPETVFYDWDQNVTDGWTVPWDLWHFNGWNIQNGTEQFYMNAIAYSLLGDKDAGDYAKDLLVRYCGFPTWNCPFYENRGQYSSLAYGFISPKVAIAYDLIYDLLNDKERRIVRDGIVRNMIIPTHRTYVENNMIPPSTSNWLAHIFGGDLLCIAAIYGDPEYQMPEEYFTGAIIKMNDYIQRSFHEDGSYAEGHGYYNYAMIGTGESLPVMENLFGIDLSEKVRGSYQELVWNSNISNDWYFSFGCDQARLHDYISQGNMAWLVEKTKDPILSWFYSDIMKKGGYGNAIIQELLHKTEDVPQKNPFALNPSRIFPEQGRTVFKSGWGPDDFAFSMTTGPYFNHEDIHMGSFWFADLGSRFIVDFWDGDKYNDPRYYGYKVQPIAHSTILIDHNEVGQRSGDPNNCPEGFDDYAFIYQHLDGQNAAFSSGDIGRLYWGEVKEMRRNILYLKPRTILMLDTVIPAQKDVDVTLLFQTLFLKNVVPGNKESKIFSGDNTLHINHIYPANNELKSVERPHFADTFGRGEKYGSGYPNTGPLLREGMLQQTARTEGAPLVMANLMKATAKDGNIDVRTQEGEGYISGSADGIPFVFSTKPGLVYSIGDISTDALAYTLKDSGIFVAMATKFIKGGKMLIGSDEPITCEINGNAIKYYKPSQGRIEIGVEKKPSGIMLDGKKVKNFAYDAVKKTAGIDAVEGEGIIEIKN